MPWRAVRCAQEEKERRPPPCALGGATHVYPFLFPTGDDRSSWAHVSPRAPRRPWHQAQPAFSLQPAWPAMVSPAGVATLEKEAKGASWSWEGPLGLTLPPSAPLPLFGCCLPACLPIRTDPPILPRSLTHPAPSYRTVGLGGRSSAALTSPAGGAQGKVPTGPGASPAEQSERRSQRARLARSLARSLPGPPRAHPPKRRRAKAAAPLRFGQLELLRPALPGPGEAWAIRSVRGGERDLPAAAPHTSSPAPSCAGTVVGHTPPHPELQECSTNPR